MIMHQKNLLGIQKIFAPFARNMFDDTHSIDLYRLYNNNGLISLHISSFFSCGDLSILYKMSTIIQSNPGCGEVQQIKLIIA